MEAPEKNGTKITTLLEEFDDIRRMVDQLAERNAALEKQRDSAVNLLEHAQRELALALIRIEELEGADEREAEEKEARDA